MTKTKHILIIKGHPREKSFCNDLVEQYKIGVETNNTEVKILNLKDLELEQWLKYDWGNNHDSVPASKDLDASKELIKWSDHIVFAYPTYWAGPPALVKLFLEMIIVTGFAFKYKKPFFGKIPHWNGLLKGRTATVMSTMDAPSIVMHLIDRDPGGKMMNDILRFVGIKLKNKYYFGSVVMSTEKKREKWLKKAFLAGKKDSRF